ncbi:hypothetical protein PCG10_010214 [Penicillium crustosum]|uniref:Uncharacterized protein n=1 Tax=Penicillium crustosum TaxID=36656 RepID=A0A9P5GW84_PENCR|nr:hypothetical protein PCG10_010214 [Penicillium crustosum]
MNARIEELQAKVAVYAEKADSQANTTDNHLASESVQASHTAEEDHFPFKLNQYSQAHTEVPQQLLKPQSPTGQMSDEILSNEGIFGHEQILMNCPSRERMPSQELIIRDLFELQAQFSNKLKHLQQDGSNFIQQHDEGNGMARALSEMAHDAALGYQQVIAPKFNEPVDFGSWRSNQEPRMLCESTMGSEAQKTTPTSSHIRDSGALKPSLPGHRDSMDERLDYLLERVEDAGFENFDSMVTAYYSSTFPESSPLSIEQSLSRERRLSRVLWEIFRSSTQWAVREREGFNEEITKICESLLITESCSAHSGLVCKLRPLILDSPNGPADATSQRIIQMKRIVTNEHPKFWAFIVGLASANPTLRPRDRSNLALAVMLLLNLAGHIPREQLIRAVISCL